MNIQLREIQVDLPSGKTLFRLSRLEIPSGSKILVKGESGKGKTTLLHLIAGLFFPTKGEVRIGEHHLSAMTDEQRCRFRRAHVGMIFQKLNLIEHLTATENVRLGLVGRASAEMKARSALHAVGLRGHEADRSSVLSLGEQQRVAVARILAAESEVILADEPTSSLDAMNAANVIDKLHEAARGNTLIVVSHDHRIEKKFSEVLDFADLVRR